MTNNLMTKGKYSKIEKENDSNIKCRTCGSHTSGNKIYTVQCLGSKKHSLFTLIKENSNDTKKLYKLVSQLMGHKEDNPLPEEDDDTKLAEQFGKFFLNKIINIRKLFHNIPPYKTQKDTFPRVDKFSTICEADLKTIINQMPNKSCQLETLNTSTLKKVIDVCIPAIIRVINLSLEKGGFHENWKTAVVKPLIKSKQEGTIKSNY